MKKLYVSLKNPSNKMSAIGFKEIKEYKAYTLPEFHLEQYISMEFLKEILDVKVIETIIDKLDEDNK